MPRMRWWLGLRPGPRWGSSRRSLNRPPSRLALQEPHASRRLDPSALAARRLVSRIYPSEFLAIHH